MNALLKYLPAPIKHQLKSWKYQIQQYFGTFVSPEPEFKLLPIFLVKGDTVIDVGANVGHYTHYMAELGATVHAYEPIPETYNLLLANTCDQPHVITHRKAVTTHNLGVTMRIPDHNLYRAEISKNWCPREDIQVPSTLLDAESWPDTVSLIKIDVEGHELQVLTGARQLLMRDHPLLIIEGNDPAVKLLLANLGYQHRIYLVNSPNTIYCETLPLGMEHYA